MTKQVSIAQKTMVAKLMATENVHIEHRKTSTALFDPVNRILYLPIWKDMHGFMYDHLGGHEVGHALYTPAEGWHDAVVNDDRKNFKTFLNVVEDIRIEKKVLRKYPGLRKSFIQGFDELLKRDFFGIADRDINALPFVDRLNVYSKSQYEMDILFSDEEKIIIEKAKQLETWEQVLEFTNELYEYSKDEQQQLQYEDEFEYSFEEQDSFDAYDELESFDVDGTELEDYEDPSKENVLNRRKADKHGESQFDPDCITDKNYRMNENSLLDDSSKEYKYFSYPEPNLNDIITPYHIVHRGMQIYSAPHMIPIGNEEVRIFKNKNEKYISLLAKEFEMRKAAKTYSKNKISETGDIDVSKLASYKFDDNIFAKITKIPRGKSHGLVLLLDYSGSMSNNMEGSIEQILVLALFCRKVNIPFVVYSFGNSSKSFYEDKKQSIDYSKCFSTNENELIFGGVQLREYLNSQMNNATFTKCFRNMMLLKKSYSQNFYRPPSEYLSSTPLTNSIVALVPIMKEFKQKNNLDITNLIIVHDGDSDYINQYSTGNGGYKFLQPHNENTFIVDKKNKLQYRIRDTDEIFETTLNWFTKVTGSKIFGFYILNSSSRSAIAQKYHSQSGDSFYGSSYRRHKYYLNDGRDISTIVKEFSKTKFLISYNRGYDKFFFVSGGKNLVTEQEELEVTGKITNTKLKTAFMKMNKKKQVSRVLISKFIEGIAV